MRESEITYFCYFLFSNQNILDLEITMDDWIWFDTVEIFHTKRHIVKR